MRALTLLIVLALLGAQPAQAGVAAYPAIYRGLGANAYGNLRAAKIAWLSANAAAVAAELAAAKAAMATKHDKAKNPGGTALERLERQADQLAAELVVMRGPRDGRQERLLKRNVESWIGAARRGGNGAVALRLIYDLQVSGL